MGMVLIRNRVWTKNMCNYMGQFVESVMVLPADGAACILIDHKAWTQPFLVGFGNDPWRKGCDHDAGLLWGCSHRTLGVLGPQALVVGRASG